MRATRGNRAPVWAVWIGLAAIVGLSAGPEVATAAAGLCAAALLASELAYRRRARAYFAALHRTTMKRHDAVLDQWMELREREGDHASTRLVNDVTRQPTAHFVTLAAQAADRRDLTRPDDYPGVDAYRDAVTDLEQSWRRLERHARGLDLWGDARRWGVDRLPDAVPALVAPLLPVARNVAQTAWRMAESRVRARTAR